jgi:hypothetical protein
MPKFSQRYGCTEIERAFQRERIDDTLRTALWNVLSACIWDLWEHPSEIHGYSQNSRRINTISKHLWFNYFKRDMDALPEFRGFNEKGAYDLFKEYLDAADFDELSEAEKRHFYKCQQCGEMIDMRQLDDVLFHEDHVQTPHIQYGGSQRLGESPN